MFFLQILQKNCQLIFTCKLTRVHENYGYYQKNQSNNGHIPCHQMVLIRLKIPCCSFTIWHIIHLNKYLDLLPTQHGWDMGKMQTVDVQMVKQNLHAGKSPKRNVTQCKSA